MKEDKALHIAHARSSSNKLDVMHGLKAGCFYCQTIFSPKEVKEFHEERDGGFTVLCPHCGIDSVISDAVMNYLGLLDEPSRVEFLKRMHDYWFAEA